MLLQFPVASSLRPEEIMMMTMMMIVWPEDCNNDEAVLAMSHSLSWQHENQKQEL